MQNSSIFANFICFFFINKLFYLLINFSLIFLFINFFLFVINFLLIY